MKLTLRQLEIFVAIARHENVSRAAEVLALSQSAASSALVELERQFSCPLFDRLGKSLRLNGMGRGLLPQAEEVLARAAAIEGFLGGGALGPVAVGATLTIGNYLATLVVAEFLRRHPGSPISLHVANTHEIVDGLLGYRLDVGMVEGEVFDPALVMTPWLDDALVVFGPPGHPLAGKAASNEELAGEAWIVREPGSGTRALFDRAIAAPLGGQVPITLALEHTEAIKRAVESGLGIGCLSRLSLREAFRRGSLVEIQTPQFDLRRRFHFVHHRQRYQSPAATEFLDCCRTISGDAGSTGELALPFIR
jgi:DNA-binding transcriptional LysR family regulator